MLNLRATSPVYLFTSQLDFRLGIDRLVELVKEHSPIKSQGYFVFFCRKKIRIKVLYWDLDGYCIWIKRLEAGKFKFDSKDNKKISTYDLTELLNGIELSRIEFRNKSKNN